LERQAKKKKVEPVCDFLSLCGLARVEPKLPQKDREDMERKFLDLVEQIGKEGRAMLNGNVTAYSPYDLVRGVTLFLQRRIERMGP
jgi:hypothetical protein